MSSVSNLLGRWRRLTGLAVAAVVALLALGLVPDARGASNVTGDRVGGSDRYATAAEIATRSYSTGATFALLARGDDFPDALAGSYLAGIGSSGPVLLTEPTRLTPVTLSALRTLRATSVILLGGEAAISAAVAQELSSNGFQVVRRGGATRYDTARAVAESVPATVVGRIGTDPTAILATGTNFPDAVSAGAVAFRAHFPVLLTAPTTLSTQADQALTNLAIKRVLLVGGTNAVSTATENQVKAKGITVTRLAGNNRGATAAAIAVFARTQTPAIFGNTHVNLARGDRFPDSLSGAPHAGREANGAPILLAESPTVLGTDTRSYLQQSNATIESVHALGGPAAVSDAVLNEARTASTCSPTTTTSLLLTITTAAPATTSVTQGPCVVGTTTPGATTTTGPGTTTTSIECEVPVICDIVFAPSPTTSSTSTSTSTSSTSSTATTAA